MPKDAPREKTTRLETFAGFFKRYMSVSAFVTAALPIPVAAAGLIATYRFQTKVLSTYTSLFCFLVLAFIFYSRHQLARLMFPELYRTVNRRPLSSAAIRLLPLVLILGSLAFAFTYQRLLMASINGMRARLRLVDVTDSVILSEGLESDTPEATVLMICYLGIFLTAESAFVLMAIKEYLQDLLEISEIELIRGRRHTTLRKKVFKEAEGDGAAQKPSGA